MLASTGRYRNDGNIGISENVERFLKADAPVVTVGVGLPPRPLPLLPPPPLSSIVIITHRWDWTLGPSDVPQTSNPPSSDVMREDFCLAPPSSPQLLGLSSDEFQSLWQPKESKMSLRPCFLRRKCCREEIVTYKFYSLMIPLSVLDSPTCDAPAGGIFVSMAAEFPDRFPLVCGRT